MKLTEFIEIDILQKIQDSFSKFTGMASITTNPEGAPITVGSGFSEFCMKYTRNGSVLGNRRCEACDKKVLCVLCSQERLPLISAMRVWWILQHLLC